jgi:hypothetical protein
LRKEGRRGTQVKGSVLCRRKRLEQMIAECLQLWDSTKNKEKVIERSTYTNVIT